MRHVEGAVAPLQEHSVPERLTPSNRTVLPAPSTSSSRARTAMANARRTRWQL
jgi:hypothetical protein